MTSTRSEGLTLEELFGEGSRRHRRRSSPTGRKRKNRKRAMIWIVVSSIVVLLLVPIGFAGIVVATFHNAYTSNVHTFSKDVIPSDGVHAGPSAAGAENILLLGSDTRASTLGDIESGTSTGGRSDTMMLVHLPADRKTVQVMSIMRDDWVSIPGHGDAKINAAMAWGGVPLVIKTVESLFGVPIDHVVVMDFDGFADMSTALNGVTVESPKAFTSKNQPGYSFVEGPNVVKGQQALAFVRERYSFPDSDYQRVRDQQSFMKGVLEKLTDTGTILNVGVLSNFIGTTSKYVVVDKGLTFNELLSTGMSLRDVKPSNIAFFTLPTLGTGTIDGQSIVRVDPDAVAGISAALKSDTFHDYVVQNKLQGGN